MKRCQKHNWNDTIGLNLYTGLTWCWLVWTWAL